MKKLTGIILAFAFVFCNSTYKAQINAPKPSPLATIKQQVGLTDIEVNYSRPGVKGRAIFGDLEKWGEIWRTGANSSTKIKTSTAITLGGKDIPAGEYALYTIPNQNEWTIIIHKNLSHSGTADYKAEEDLVRFTAKPTALKDTVETFTIDFNNLTYDGAQLQIKWQTTLLSIPIVTKANEMVEKQIKDQLIDGPSAGSYASAAGYYLENNKDLGQALIWIDKAIAKRAEAFWYLNQKANILAKTGKTKEAIMAAEKSIELAKINKDGDFGYIAKNEKLIKELKAKK